MPSPAAASTLAQTGKSWQQQWTRRGDEIGGYPDGFVFRQTVQN